jgi:hypothetical protein
MTLAASFVVMAAKITSTLKQVVLVVTMERYCQMDQFLVRYYVQKVY